MKAPQLPKKPPRGSGSALDAWNLCLAHDPSLAGLYRAVNDFSQALDAPILSFDDGRRDRSALFARDSAHRLICASPFMFRDCHLISQHVSEEAENLLRDTNLLIAHSFFRGHVPWARRWASRRGKRYWVVPHGCLDPWGLTRRGLAKRMWLSLHGKRCLADADKLVFSTQRELEKAQPWLHRDNGVVIHWPVDLPDMTSRDECQRLVRANRGIPADAKVLVFVGRLHSMKRPLDLIRAFINARPANSHLLIVGMQGDLTYQAVAAEIPTAFTDRIHVLGQLDHMLLTEALFAADAFISLSFRENFGYAMADALAHALPIIVTPGHDLAHELPTAKASGLTCGWLLPDDTLEAAAAAISEFDRLAVSETAAMGRAGRDWAAMHLSRESFRSGLLSLIGST